MAAFSLRWLPETLRDLVVRKVVGCLSSVALLLAARVAAQLDFVRVVDESVQVKWTHDQRRTRSIIHVHDTRTLASELFFNTTRVLKNRSRGGSHSDHTMSSRGSCVT